jgi:hypothetical protein
VPCKPDLAFESWVAGANRGGDRLIDCGPSSGHDASSTSHEHAGCEADDSVITATIRSAYREY